MLSDEEEEEEAEEESLNPAVLAFPVFPFPSGKAVECFRFSAPQAELWPLGYAGTDCRKVEDRVRGAGDGGVVGDGRRGEERKR